MAKQPSSKPSNKVKSSSNVQTETKKKASTFKAGADLAKTIR